MRLLLALLLLALPARAEMPEAGSFQHAETRFGSFDVVDGSESKGLVWREKNWQVPGVEAYGSLSIRFAVARPDDDSDWLLLDIWQGGNDCSTSDVQLVRVTAQGAWASEEFAGCLPDASDFRLAPGRAEMDFDVPSDVTVASRTYVFDGNALTTIDHPATIPPPGSPVPDPRSWVGRSAWEPFQDMAEVGRFAQVMPPPDINDLLAHMSGPGDDNVEQGGWVLGAACMAHACNVSGGAFGIRIADGAVAAVIYDEGQADRSFGMVSDPTIAAWIAQNRPH